MEERYVCIYLDATHIPIRRQTVEKEAVYIAIGITEEGNKEVLDFTIAPTESSHVWEELIQGLRERGVENVLLFISDGLPGKIGRASCRERMGVDGVRGAFRE